MSLPQKLPPDFISELKKQMAAEEQKRAVYRAENKRLKKQSLNTSLSGMQNNGWVTVYTNQVPYELDVLRSNLYPKSDLGWFIRTVLGVGLGNPLFAAGFDCEPISPPGLSVTVGPGVIYYFDLLLPTDYSVIPADTNPDHQIYKSFINFNTQTFATPAPVTPGNNIIYLIQAAHQTENVNVVNRPYFNDADPSSPIFESQSDTMIDFTNLGIKAGVAAPSPTPPTPDVGFIGLYYVTVAYGQTAIISGNITVVPGAPFITESLTQKISTADLAGYVTKPQEQNSSNVFALDIGTANVYQVNATPAYGSYVAGTQVKTIIANSNTGASTLQINSNSATNIQVMTPTGLSDLAGGELIAGGAYEFIYNGTVFQLLNPTGGVDGSILVGQITMQAATTADSGYLPLSTTPVSRTTYARLFSRIGTTWGPGDGSTTFNLPPPGYTPVGAGWGGYSPTLTDAVGATGGEATHTLSTGEIPSHQHSSDFPNAFNSNANSGAAAVISQWPASTPHLTTPTGGGGSHNNIQPSMVVLFQIKF